MLSKEELSRKLNELSENTSSKEARILFDDLSDYLNDAYDGPEPWDEDNDDVTPEYAAWEKKALEDLGVNESIFDTLNSLSEQDNPVTSKVAIDKDGDGDADITIVKQDDGNDDDDESLVIGGTDIYKEPFTEEQLAILRNDGDYTKFSTDEFNALQASDFAKARKARNAWIKRARELLESESSDKPHDESLVAKPGEPAPDSDNFTNDIARTLANKRW